MAAADDEHFSEGQDAFDIGVGPFVCPYPPESRAGRFWLAGWDEARRYEERHGRDSVSSTVAVFTGDLSRRAA